MKMLQCFNHQVTKITKKRFGINLGVLRVLVVQIFHLSLFSISLSPNRRSA